MSKAYVVVFIGSLLNLERGRERTPTRLSRSKPKSRLLALGPKAPGPLARVARRQRVTEDQKL